MKYKDKTNDIQETVKNKYGIKILNNLRIPKYEMSGCTDFETIIAYFGNALSVAEPSHQMNTQLEIIKQHSLMGSAYYNALKYVNKGKDDFYYPSTKLVLYEFGRILAKLTSYGIIINDDYKKYVVWRKSKEERF